MTDRKLLEQALDALIENARLLGITQAKQGYGFYSQQDAIVESALHECIAKHSAALLERLARPEQEPVLQDIEQYRMQMASISTAAIGYWKEGDGIHPDYDTPALRDVAMLYAKYDALYKAQPEQEPVAWMYSEGLAALKAGKCWTAYGTKQDKDNSIPLYTAPPERQPLTYAEMKKIADEHLKSEYQPASYEMSGVFDLIRAVEYTKLKEEK